MKIRLLLLAALIVICGCSQPLDCKKFKQGTFIVHYGGHTDIIKRWGDTQAEFVDTEKTPNMFLVKWINDHTYTLTPQENVLTKEPKLPRNALMTVTITRTDSNSYTEITSWNFSTITDENDIFKIK